MADGRPGDPASGAPPGGDPGGVRHVYVHAPFCARRCFYCDFAVTVNRHGGWEVWAGALEQELALLEDPDGGPAGPGRSGDRSPPVNMASRLDTLFIGGGTPSLLGPGAMAALRSALGATRLDHADLEWTAEANPESLTPELASAWAAAGLNRLSLGVQSFQEPVLRWMGRLHGAAGARGAVTTARDRGIRNLSVDLIFGLPATLERDWRGDLEAALSLGVPHISLYGLTAEAGTPLARQVSRGRVRMPDDGRYEDEYLEAHQLLTSAGYRHYEVSNFALPGFESRHNRAYWTGVPYLGLGNSAHSLLPPVRRWNRRDWADYVAELRAGRLPVEEEEVPGPEAAELERIWLGLRTDRGVALSTLDEGDRERIRTIWLPRGLAEVDGDRIRLTPRGWLLLDELTVELAGRPAQAAPGSSAPHTPDPVPHIPGAAAAPGPGAPG